MYCSTSMLRCWGPQLYNLIAIIEFCIFIIGYKSSRKKNIREREFKPLEGWKKNCAQKGWFSWFCFSIKYLININILDEKDQFSTSFSFHFLYSSLFDIFPSTWSLIYYVLSNFPNQFCRNRNSDLVIINELQRNNFNLF